MFVVMEIQVFSDGKMSTPCYAYEDRNKAEAKYHNILAGASVSKLPKHSAIMVTDDGFYLKSESYTHKEEEDEGTAN